MIHYIFSGESLRVANSLQIANSLRILFSVCWGPSALFGDRKGTTNKKLSLCDKNPAQRSGELPGANCLKTLVLLGHDPVAPSNCSENSLVLFVLFLGFVSPFWLPSCGTYENWFSLRTCRSSSVKFS